MFHFADRNVMVFKVLGITNRKKGSGGINKTTGGTVRRVKMSMVNKTQRKIDHDSRQEVEQAIDAVNTKEVGCLRSIMATA